MKNVSFSEMIKNSKDGATIHKKMLETYKEIVVSESALNGYKKFLEDTLKSEEGILFHCFAGKDRTGFGAALILKIAGASDEQIIEDYLETNVMRKLENKKILQKVSNELSEEQLSALKKALNVNLDYLNYAKKVLIEEYGDFTNYLTFGLTLDDDYLKKFREKYVINQK